MTFDVAPRQATDPSRRTRTEACMTRVSPQGSVFTQTFPVAARYGMAVVLAICPVDNVVIGLTDSAPTRGVMKVSYEDGAVVTGGRAWASRPNSGISCVHRVAGRSSPPT